MDVAQFIFRENKMVPFCLMHLIELHQPHHGQHASTLGTPYLSCPLYQLARKVESNNNIVGPVLLFTLQLL